MSDKPEAEAEQNSRYTANNALSANSFVPQAPPASNLPYYLHYPINYPLNYPSSSNYTGSNYTGANYTGASYPGSNYSGSSYSGSTAPSSSQSGLPPVSLSQGPSGSNLGAGSGSYNYYPNLPHIYDKEDQLPPLSSFHMSTYPGSQGPQGPSASNTTNYNLSPSKSTFYEQLAKRRRHTTTVHNMTPETAARNRCTICQKQFKRPSSLQTHMYSHTGEKLFKCPWPECGKQFSVKSNMTRHYKLHIRETDPNN